MVVLATIEEWQRQTSLLLQARPTTTRITTKYNVPNLASAKYQNAKKRKRNSEVGGKDITSDGPRIPRATLTLKTFDPESGVCLKVKTDKAADVGRLVNGLRRLARHMAALQQKTEEVIMQDAPAGAQGDGSEVVSPPPASAITIESSQQQQSGTAGKKKKKGKK